MGVDMSVGDLAFRCDRDRSALVVIDVQWDFCAPRSAPFGERDISRIDAMVEHLQWLIGKARDTSVPVVFVRTHHDETTDSQYWVHKRGDDSPPSDNCRPGTDGAAFFRINEKDADVVVTKHRFDAFIGTNLELVLRSLRRDSVIMAGVMTDVCVETSARHALCSDFYLTVASDCCDSYTLERHESALRRLGDMFGLVATSAQIGAHWS